MQHTLLSQKAREISNQYRYPTTPADKEASIGIFAEQADVHLQTDHLVCFNHLDEEFVQALADGKHLAFILSTNAGK